MPLRSFTQAEMILSERQRMDRLLLGTVWVGVAACSLAEGAWFYLIAISFAVVVSFLAVRRGKEVHVGRLFINLGVFASGAILVTEVFATRLPALQAISHFLILLQVCKLFERKYDRDYIQILALSFLTVVAATMLYHTLWFAATAVVYLTLLCRTAMVFTLKRGLEAALSARLATDSLAPKVDQLAWNVIRTWPDKALRRHRTLIVGVCLLFGVVMFLVAPRSESPSLGPAGRRASTTTGFDGKVRLGDHAGKVYQSNKVLMHVRFKVPPGSRLPIGPASYLRGATFDQYHNSRWSKRQVLSDPQWDAPPPRVTEAMLAEAMVTEISMSPSLLPNLFTCHPVIAMTYLDRPDQAISIRTDMTAKLPEHKVQPGHVSYRAYSLAWPLSENSRKYLAGFRKFVNSRPLGDSPEELDAPPSVRRLAVQWCEDLLEQRRDHPELRDRLDIQIARRIAAKLSSNYDYTLDLSDADPNRDGVEDFLFYTKKGHCEYFASAQTVLSRSVGIQARLVAGFVPNEYDPAGKYYVIRGRDAHAWCEVYTPSTDWIPIDPTPSASRDEAHGKTFFATASKSWAQLEFMWYDRVVGYDTSMRHRLWSAAADRVSALVATVVQRAQSLLLTDILDRAVVRLLILVVLVTVIVEGILLGRWARGYLRRRREFIGHLKIPASQMKFMRDLLRLLESRGLYWQSRQTLREFALKASTQLDLSAEIMENLVGLAYQARWGYEALSRKEILLAGQQLERLQATLGAQKVNRELNSER